jgi:hypothetical protein
MPQYPIYVSEGTLARIRKIIEKLQKASPFTAVKKSHVRDEIESDYTQPKVCRKTIGRAFKKLIERKDIAQDGRGQYWLPEFRANRMDYLKKKLKSNEGIIELARHFLDALVYCDSDDDWALLQAFFTKMRDNRYEREFVEFEKADQELTAKIMEEIEKEKKS